MVRAILTFVSLTLLWVFAGPTTAQPKEPFAPEGGGPRQVTGIATTTEGAKKAALENAVKEVETLMRKNGLTSFKPSEAFVSTHLLDGVGKAGKEELIKVVDQEVNVQKWIVNFRTDTNWWGELVRRDRESLRKINAEERQWFAGRLLFGLTVVLLSGYGYVQLDRQTHHRYTTWLRVVGVGVVSVVLATFWWIVNS